MPHDPSPASALRAWLDDAQARHADAPGAIADALTDRAATLPADAEGAEALRLAEHVWLAHLGDAAGLQAFADRLPATVRDAAATASSLQRVQWALAVLSGGRPPALADAPRWRALQNVVLAMAMQAREAEADTLLHADEATALALGGSEAGQAFAAMANNVASHLQDRAGRDAAGDALMLRAAALARRAWASAGTWMHVERADYRLALCHAAAGRGAEAVAHAQRCLAACVAAGEEADAMEHFFAHEALVRAYGTAADAPAAAVARQRMQALLAEIPEADGLRAWCADVLSTLPG